MNSWSCSRESGNFTVSAGWICRCVKEWWSGSRLDVGSVVSNWYWLNGSVNSLNHGHSGFNNMVFKYGHSATSHHWWWTFWNWVSDWWSASMNVVSWGYDLLFVHGSNLKHSRLAVKLQSKGFISLHEWIEFGGEGSILSSNNSNVAVQWFNLAL